MQTGSEATQDEKTLSLLSQLLRFLHHSSTKAKLKYKSENELLSFSEVFFGGTSKKENILKTIQRTNVFQRTHFEQLLFFFMRKLSSRNNFHINSHSSFVTFFSLMGYYIPVRPRRRSGRKVL